MRKYEPEKIEHKWQQRWAEAGVFRSRPDRSRTRFFVTVAWPYPSGPMHVGHARTYTVPDVIVRYKRMRGFNCLFPMGWHLTGSPIVGAIKRIQGGDSGYIATLRDKYGLSPEEIERLKDPMSFARFWISESRLGYKLSMSALGYGIDWDRECTSLDPHFSRMVEWQYGRLRDRGLVTIGSHPVKFCPRDMNAVTDHDLLEGEGVGISEFVLIKYRLEDGSLCLPASTLRPETIFGVTNIWLHPDAIYAEIETGGERWVVSEQAIEKLTNQGRELRVLRSLKGRELIGKKVVVPVTGAVVPILPAVFVKPDHTTGVVGSVPAHAPFDLVALQDLQRSDSEMRSFGLDPEMVRSLSPIEMIEVEGGGESAEELVRELGVRDQRDLRKLDEATQRIYKLEFNKGRMAANTGPYKGTRVSRAKEEVKRELMSRGDAELMYEFSDLPVICRCGSPCVVRVVRDQWFIRYSDPAWKEEAREALESMELVPPETRTYFLNVVDWLHDWPCTRRVGMGTRLPWDSTGWVIESLSDSTIYMAYYTLVPWMKRVKPEQLDPPVFDYVFRGEGSPADVASRTGIPIEILEGMRNEFTYWYPQNYRVSANELIPNHLTFMIFHHLATMPRELCPRGIVSLGLGVLEGQRMSSSRGVVFAVSDAVDRFGADVTRFYLMYMCEPWQDFDWRGAQAEAHRHQLERFFTLAQELMEPGSSRESPVDRWLLSRLSHHVAATGQAYEGFQTRRALQHSFFLLQQEVRWYLRRGGANRELLRKLLDSWLRLLAPIIPHICEELWEMLGARGFIADAPFPTPDESLRDEGVEFREDVLKGVAEDVWEILKVTRIVPRRVFLYLAPPWKWAIYRIALDMAARGTPAVGELIKAALKAPEARGHEREVPPVAQKALAEVGRLPEGERRLRALPLDERALMEEVRELLARELGCEVLVCSAEAPDRHDPQNKARNAFPLRPAIFIEGSGSSDGTP
ncbi:MAG: leucine--tRNA ligase [Thermoplasmatota archaeon]